jgi:hypothetical protein
VNIHPTDFLTVRPFTVSGTAWISNFVDSWND